MPLLILKEMVLNLLPFTKILGSAPDRNLLKKIDSMKKPNFNVALGHNGGGSGGMEPASDVCNGRIGSC